MQASVWQNRQCNKTHLLYKPPVSLCASFLFDNAVHEQLVQRAYARFTHPILAGVAADSRAAPGRGRCDLTVQTVHVKIQLLSAGNKTTGFHSTHHAREHLRIDVLVRFDGNGFAKLLASFDYDLFFAQSKPHKRALRV